MHDPEALWVQLQDGSALVLERPHVFLDTLRGVNAGGYRSIALRNVVSLRALEPSSAKTALLVAASVAVTVGTVLVITADRVQP